MFNDGWKDQLTAVNGIPLKYDANGNVPTYGSRSYTWTDGRKDKKGNNFYKKAVSLFKSAIKTYNNKAKLDKQFLNKNNSQYKSLLSSLQKERDKKISSACFTLGKALHCFQDIYAHGNITAGPATGKYTYRLKGHAGREGVDNPYFNWESGSGKTQVVETKKLTQRYYDTQDKSLTILLTFLYDVNYSSLIKVK